jgi:hypothetical protein
MIFSKRSAKRIAVELPVKVYFFDNKGKTRIGESLAGSIKNFSPLGAALTVGAILLNGKHLFYSCQDNPDIVLELEFEFRDSGDQFIAVPAEPVWFDKDLGSGKKEFDVGVKFLADTKGPEIRALCKEACEDEKRRISLWKKFF